MKKLTKSVLAVVLTASFSVSYAQKTKVDTTGTKDIQEVVVTALGIKREEKSLTYASQQVKASDLNLTQSVDVKGAIVGKVAGVQINGQAGSKLGETGKLRLRGAVSLTADEDPLYVLDGVVVDPNSIDMDNVESVNILKGPNATALYGQRAEYGVILLTLKKGSRNKLNIELNSTTTVDMIARTMKYQNVYGQGYEGDASLQTFHFDSSFHPAEWSVFDGMRYKAGDNNLADESWGAKFDGEEYIPWYAWWKDSPYYGQTAKYEAQPNNVKDFYNKAVTLKNTISLSGGKEGFLGRLSFTNLNQNGITPYTNLKKNFLNSTFSLNLSDDLKIDAVFNLSDGNIKGEYDDGYSNQTSGSFNQWFARDLDINKLKELRNLETPKKYHASWNWWGPDYYGDGGIYEKPAFWFNPFMYMERFENNNKVRNILISFMPTYKINNNVNIVGQFSRRNDISNYSYFMPYYISKNGSGREGGYMDYLNGFGVTDREYIEDNYDLRVNFKKRIKSFDINGFAGGSMRVENTYRNSTNMNVFGRLSELIIADTYDFRNASVIPATDLDKYTKRVHSMYAFGSIGYDDYIFVDATVRQDYSSALPKNNNGIFTASLGGSLLVHKFFNENKYLSFFKLRAGIAQIGSDLSAGAINPQYRLSPMAFKVYNKGREELNLIENLPSRKIDENLKPAINQNIEFGADLKFINNRIGLSATYYNEVRKNEIIPVTMPSSAGYFDILTNSGTSRRKGIELSLTGDIIKNDEGFNWTTSINFAKNKTIIESIAEGLESIDAPGGTSAFAYVSVKHLKGEEWGQLVGAGFQRDVNGNKIINENGTYAVEQNVNFGSVLPEFTGGIYNSLGYKGVRLSASIDFQKGGKFFSLSEQWGNSSGLLEQTALFVGKDADGNEINVRDDIANGGGVRVIGVTSDGAAFDQKVDAYTYFTQFHGNRLAEEYIRDASYIKLREVALSYDLPKNLFTSSTIRGISIGFVARNPWLIAVSKDNYHKFDPSEMSQTYGEDGQLPSTKGYGVNVKINF